MKCLIKWQIVGVLFISKLVQATDESIHYIQLSDGLLMAPGVKIAREYNDNIYSRNSLTESDQLTKLSPYIVLTNNRTFNQAGVSYNGVFASYDQNEDDNFNDHKFNAFTNFNKNSRHQLKLSASYSQLHENRGTGFSELDAQLFPTPVEFNDKLIFVNYQYGSHTAIARISGRVSRQKRKFQNYRNITRFRDIDITAFSTEFDYKVGYVSSVLLNFQLVANRYQNQAPDNESLDNKDYFALVGYKWNIESKTTGYAKFGYQNKQFDSVLREDFDGSIVEMSLQWQPLTYSVLELRAGRASKNPNTVGDYIQQDTIAMDWTHDWSYRLTSIMSINYRNNQLVGANRVDEHWRGKLGMQYRLFNWLGLDLGYELVAQDSTSLDLSFDRNIANFGINVGL